MLCISMRAVFLCACCVYVCVCYVRTSGPCERIIVPSFAVFPGNHPHTHQRQPAAGDVESALELVPTADAVVPPVRRVTAAGPSDSAAGVVVAEGSALRIFADFPVLLDLCVHNVRAIDTAQRDRELPSGSASASATGASSSSTATSSSMQGLTRMVSGSSLVPYEDP